MPVRGDKYEAMFSRRWAWADPERAKVLNEERLQYGLPTHISPFSTLVAAMSNNWEPGCFEAVTAMCDHASSQGYEVLLYEEPDRCYQRYDALGAMRNMAYLKAIQEGWEWILYVDNDVAPPPEALTVMLERFCPIIGPLFEFPETDARIPPQGRVEPGQGVIPANSLLLSMVLFKTAVFLPWARGGFWGNAIGEDEGYHFSKLQMSGHRCFVDTDVVVPCRKPPTYPLDKKRKDV